VFRRLTHVNTWRQVYIPNGSLISGSLSLRTAHKRYFHISNQLYSNQVSLYTYITAYDRQCLRSLYSQTDNMRRKYNPAQVTVVRMCVGLPCAVPGKWSNPGVQVCCVKLS
jgi:hypothetical protein